MGGMIDASLVLEGGGLRGVYTSGALRLFGDKGLKFRNIIGVSMGACNGANYTSCQYERSRMSNINFVDDARYLSYRRWLTGGDLFGMDFLFNTLPNELIPFDYDAFRASPVRFRFTITDCFSGRAVHVEKNDLDPAHFKEDAMAVLRASCSLPLISEPVEWRGSLYMDGGIADPIPVRTSVETGASKHLFILTQPSGYRKTPTRMAAVCRLRHPSLTGMHKALRVRHERYNSSLDMIRELEKSGTGMVLRPAEKLPAGRICRDKNTLYAVYDQGYYDALNMLPRVQEFLGRQPRSDTAHTAAGGGNTRS